MKTGFCLICYEFLPDELLNQKPEVVQSISTLLALPNIPYESIFKDSLICARCYENSVNSYEALEKLKEIQEEILNLRSFFENEFKLGYELSLTRGNKVVEFLDYNEERTKIVKKLDLIQIQNTTTSQKAKKPKLDRNRNGIQEIANFIIKIKNENDNENEPISDLPEGYFNDLNNFLEEQEQVQENDSYILPDVLPDISIPSDDEDCDPCWTPTTSEKNSKPLPTSTSTTNQAIKLKNLQMELRRLELPSDCTTFNIEEDKYLASFIKAEKFEHFLRKRRFIDPEPQEKKPLGEFMYCSHEGCNFKSRHQRIMESHQRKIHQGFRRTKPHKCPLEDCSMRFQEKRRLKAHMITHQTEKPFTCHQCGRSFKQDEYLENHIAAIHDDTSKFKCSVCFKGYSHASTLRKHEKRHREEAEMFTCRVCSKEYKSQYSLKEHLLLHEGIKPKCPICSKEFLVKNSLDQHLLITHTKNEDKPYKCYELGCTKAFINNYSLQKHIKRSHLKQRNFICDECGKGFFTPAILKAHQEKHTGIRKFQCNVCPAAFFDGGHLRRHEENVHAEDVKSFQCDLCEMSFVTKHNLSNHKWRHRKQMEKGRQFIPRLSRQNIAYQKKKEENTLK